MNTLMKTEMAKFEPSRYAAARNVREICMIRPTRAVVIVLAGWALAGLAAHADQDKRQGVSEAKAHTLVVKPNTKSITEPNAGTKETRPAPPAKETEPLKSSVQKKADDVIAGQQQKIG